MCIRDRAGGLALDVACGAGRLLRRYLQAGLAVEGVDSSADMLAVCRQKAAADGLAHAEVPGAARDVLERAVAPVAEAHGRLAEQVVVVAARAEQVDPAVVVRVEEDAAPPDALAAGLDSTPVQGRLTARAAELGARPGSTWAAGSAVGDRAQVVRATGMDSATLARQLAADPEVAYAVPNGRKRVLAAPNDPFYLQGPSVNLNAQTGGPISGQWYLRAPDDTLRSAIGIEAAWSRTLGSSHVLVAVLPFLLRGHPDAGKVCLLYTSDAADERSSVDLGGRRIIKKKKEHYLRGGRHSSHAVMAHVHRCDRMRHSTTRYNKSTDSAKYTKGNASDQ